MCQVDEDVFHSIMIWFPCFVCFRANPLPPQCGRHLWIIPSRESGTPRVLSGFLSFLINRCIRRASLRVKWTRLPIGDNLSIGHLLKHPYSTTLPVAQVLALLVVRFQFGFLPPSSASRIVVPPDHVAPLVKPRATHAQNVDSRSVAPTWRK